ncbi:MAG: hypothetical protein LAT82_03640 [Nanoarchaeota archaeon]|nr:hypothetical protein [Nanoarchaeota archaeon]
MMYSNNKKAAQGVGTLIIFIALILVAAVAAAVLISTASNLQSSAFDVGSQTNERILTSIEVVQIIASNTSNGFINATDGDTYRMRVRLGAGSMPIKLDDLTVSVDTASNSQVVIYEDGPIVGEPDLFNVTYRTGAPARDGYLEPGQLVDILFEAEANVGERERITFTVLSTNGAPVPVSLLTPSVMIQESTSLYP